MKRDLFVFAGQSNMMGAASYLTYPGQNEEDWFIKPSSMEYRDCRDSFFGYNNNHINEKGFSLIAERAVKTFTECFAKAKSLYSKKKI